MTVPPLKAFRPIAPSGCPRRGAADAAAPCSPSARMGRARALHVDTCRGAAAQSLVWSATSFCSCRCLEAAYGPHTAYDPFRGPQGSGQGAVQRGLLGAVVFVVDRGAIRCPLGGCQPMACTMGFRGGELERFRAAPRLNRSECGPPLCALPFGGSVLVRPAALGRRDQGSGCRFRVGSSSSTDRTTDIRPTPDCRPASQTACDCLGE